MLANSSPGCGRLCACSQRRDPGTRTDHTQRQTLSDVSPAKGPPLSCDTQIRVGPAGCIAHARLRSRSAFSTRAMSGLAPM